MLNQSISFTLEGNDVGLAHTVLFLTSSETIHSLSLSSLFVCLFEWNLLRLLLMVL